MRPFILIPLFLAQLVCAQVRPQQAFTIKERDLIPEGIIYDSIGKQFFVGSIHKKKIVKITTKGNVSDFIVQGQYDVLEVLGMKVDAANRRLWVCNNSPEWDTVNLISNVHVFDLRRGAVLKKYQLTGSQSHLFNDIYLTRSGDAYITDSNGGGVYVIRKGGDSIEEFVKPGTFAYPNGITATADEKRLVVSVANGSGLATVDLESKEIRELQHDKFLMIGSDGLYRYKNSLIGIQNVFFPDAIHRFYLNKDQDGIERIELLSVNDPHFDTPTTGVVVGDEFYFISNSQLTGIDDDTGKLKDPEKLKDVVIMKIRLN